MLSRLALSTALAALLVSNAFAQTAPADDQMSVVIADEAVDFAPAAGLKLTLPSADGSQTREYDVSDFSVSVSRSFAYDLSGPRSEISSSLSITSVADDFLLAWLSQVANASDQARSITIRSDNAGTPQVFELDGARVIGLNLSAGSMSMLSLQLGMQSLTVNGVRMN